MVFAFVALGIVVVVLAGAVGRRGFTRKLEREGRRVASGRWPRR